MTPLPKLTCSWLGNDWAWITVFGSCCELQQSLPEVETLYRKANNLERDFGRVFGLHPVLEICSAFFLKKLKDCLADISTTEFFLYFASWCRPEHSVNIWVIPVLRRWYLLLKVSARSLPRRIFQPLIDCRGVTQLDRLSRDHPCSIFHFFKTWIFYCFKTWIFKTCHMSHVSQEITEHLLQRLRFEISQRLCVIFKGFSISRGGWNPRLRSAFHAWSLSFMILCRCRTLSFEIDTTIPFSWYHSLNLESLSVSRFECTITPTLFVITKALNDTISDRLQVGDWQFPGRGGNGDGTGPTIWLTFAGHVFESSRSSISSLLVLGGDTGGSPPRETFLDQPMGAQLKACACAQVSMHKRIESELEMLGRKTQRCCPKGSSMSENWGNLIVSSTERWQNCWSRMVSSIQALQEGGTMHSWRPRTKDFNALHEPINSF